MPRSQETYTMYDTHRWHRQFKSDGRWEAVDEATVRAALGRHYIDIDTLMRAMENGEAIGTPHAWYEQAY